MINRTAAFLKRGRFLSHLPVFGATFLAAAVSAFATGSVTLAWMPSADASVVGYNLYYGGASGVYTNTIHAANTTNAIVSGLMDGATYYFAATAYDSSGVESPFSNEATYAVPFSNNTTATNLPPTLNALGNLTLNQNAGLQTVSLSGITSGAASENQYLTVSATSSNPALIPTPAVNYGSANTTGLLYFSPATNATGTAVISVTVNDGQSQNNTTTRTFTVTVKALNPPPTLNPIADLYLTKNSGARSVMLGGIAFGTTPASKKQKIRITAVSSNPGLLKSLKVKYKSPSTGGTLNFKLVKNAAGTATITVTVNNGATINNSISRTFTVSVLAPATNNVVAAKTRLVTTTTLPATLTPAAHGPGEFTLTLSGDSSQSYIIQASDNLVDWVSVQTNTAPSTYTDTQAGKHSQRFYRAVSAQ